MKKRNWTATLNLLLSFVNSLFSSEFHLNSYELYFNDFTWWLRMINYFMSIWSVRTVIYFYTRFYARVTVPRFYFPFPALSVFNPGGDNISPAKVTSGAARQLKGGMHPMPPPLLEKVYGCPQLMRKEIEPFPQAWFSNPYFLATWCPKP